MITIDISGPNGNAHAVKASVTGYMRQLGHNEDEIKTVMYDMMSDDYTHLIAVANNFLKGIVEYIFFEDDDEDDFE